MVNLQEEVDKFAPTIEDGKVTFKNFNHQKQAAQAPQKRDPNSKEESKEVCDEPVIKGNK